MATSATAIFPGDTALLGDERVRIHQINSDGSILCFRASGSYRAEPGELATIPADAHPVRLWYLARVDARDPGGRLPMVEAMEDYRTWCEIEGIEPVAGANQDRFRRALRAAGGHAVNSGVRSYFGTRFRMCVVGRLKPKARR